MLAHINLDQWVFLKYYSFWINVQLTPEEFVQLTIELFGENAQPERSLPPAPLPVLTPTGTIHKKIKIISAPKVSGPRSKKREAEIAAAAVAADAIAQAAAEAEKLVIAERNSTAAVIAAEALAIFEAESGERITYVTRPIWRMSLFGASGTRGYGMNQDEEVVERERLEDKRLQREQKKLDMEEEERFLLGYDD